MKTTMVTPATALSISCNHATTSATKGVVDTSLGQQVEEALRSLDSNLTKEYQRANEVIPTIVRKETVVADFLRVEHNDPKKAAARLARYWKVRKLLFRDRWLLPMTMTGTGALTPAQAEIARCGFAKVAHSPANGFVFLTDYTLLPKGSAHAQVEILFYFLTIYPMEMKGLFVVRSGERPPMSFTDLVRQILDSVAANVTEQYVAQAYEGGKEHLLDFLGYQHRRVSETNMKVPITHIAADSTQGTFRMLQQHGFDRHMLPRALGGNVDRSFFDDFIRTRMSIEDIMSSAPAVANVRLGSASSLALSVDTIAVQPFASSPPSINGAILPVVKKRKQRGKESLSLVRLPNETEAQFAKRKFMGKSLGE